VLGLALPEKIFDDGDVSGLKLSGKPSVSFSEFSEYLVRKRLSEDMDDGADDAAETGAVSRQKLPVLVEDCEDTLDGK